MTMSMTREKWLEYFGWCEILQNTPDVVAELETGALDGMPTSAYVWSEFENQCEKDEYFAGTQWSEIINGVRRDAAHFYLREKPFEGYWVQIHGEIYGAHNRNSYRCDHCGHRWIDEYPGVPDDDCNECGNRRCQAWLTEELDREGNVVATVVSSDADKEPFERGRRDGFECDDLRAKRAGGG